MTNDIKLAFDHPEARAAATAATAATAASTGNDFYDRISLRDHTTSVEIGAFQVERDTSQRLSFDVVVEVRAASAPLDDDVDRILSYDTLTEAIAYELAAERLNLLETLAERVALRILQEPQAMRVFVRIQKLDRGPGALGVEIVRRRPAQEATPLDEKPLHPLIVFVENTALIPQTLAPWIDRLEKQAPVVLCVGLPENTAPKTADPASQRRVDLLEIEQNAWQLASWDPRCVVVDSRTELDWAMKQGKLCVWAPSRLVMDAVDGPKNGADGLGLTRWLAGQLQADRVIVIGESAKHADLPTYAADAPESFQP